MDIKYGYSPIIEALCEFRFDPNPNWDLTTPGLFFEKVKNKFPIKEQTSESPNFEIRLEGASAPKISQPSKILFYTENRKSFIAVRQSSISIHVLKPYPKWEVFKPYIDYAYDGLIHTIPNLVLKRIGLRYINKIEISKKQFQLNDYFEFRPFLGDKLPSNLKNFIVGCETEFSEGRDLCRFQLVSAEGNETSTFFTLDIDFFTENKEALSEINPLEWIDNAHKDSASIFEGAITDNLRKLFEERAHKK